MRCSNFRLIGEPALVRSLVTVLDPPDWSEPDWDALIAAAPRSRMDDPAVRAKLRIALKESWRRRRERLFGVA